MNNSLVHDLSLYKYLFVNLQFTFVISSVQTAKSKCSVTVCSSSSSVSTKFDPDLLKNDVAHARNRVSRLKRELEQIRAEMSCTQRGVETLVS